MTSMKHGIVMKKLLFASGVLAAGSVLAVENMLKNPGFEDLPNYVMSRTVERFRQYLPPSMKPGMVLIFR